MCQILSFYNKNLTAPVLNRYGTYKAGVKHNSDGTAIVSYDPEENKINRFRKMSFESSIAKNILNTAPVVNVHLRQATSGIVKEKNIHFWKKDRWLFAHNGWVSDYYNFKSVQKKADSLKFFHHLWNIGALGREEPDYNAIKNAIARKSLSGRFILIDIEKKVAYYFGDYHSYVFNNELVISSTKLTWKSGNSFWGADFFGKGGGYTEKEIEGIFKINFKDKEFNFVDENYSLGGSYGYDYGSAYKSGSRIVKRNKKYQQRESSIEKDMPDSKIAPRMRNENLEELSEQELKEHLEELDEEQIQKLF